MLKIALSVLAIIGVAYSVDLSVAWQHMVNQNLWLLAVAGTCMVMQIGFGGLRWHVILARLGVPNPVPESLRLFYIAAFFNNWLWGAVSGDLARVWLSYRARASVATAISSVVLDRVAAVAGVAVLVLVTAPLFVAYMGSMISALIPAGVAIAGLGGIMVAAQLHRLPLPWQHSRLLRGFQTLSHDAGTVFLRPASVIPALGLAVAAQTALAISTYFVAQSMDIALTLLECLVLMQPVVLITALPISVGGWGVRETAMITLFSAFGVPTSAALAMSVQIGLLSMLVSLPGAVLWLRLKHRTADR